MISGGPVDDTVGWLLDSDPSLRWQVMRDVVGASDEAVAAERTRISSEGWGARLLDLQQPDGNWGGGAWVRRSWASTLETLILLRDLGIDPVNERARLAIDRVRANSEWGAEHGHAPFFEGEVEPCINGRVLAIGAYFGVPVERLVDRLLGEQLPDGGWNCDAPPSRRSSFNTTICVLEGLLEYERARGTSGAVSEARLRGEEFLLERRLFRSASTGRVIERDRRSGRDWRRFTFPPRWHYDVLRALDHLRRADIVTDDRAAEALDLVAASRLRSGRWARVDGPAGTVHFELETGAESRWTTLRALRVLRASGRA